MKVEVEAYGVLLYFNERYRQQIHFESNRKKVQKYMKIWIKSASSVKWILALVT